MAPEERGKLERLHRQRTVLNGQRKYGRKWATKLPEYLQSTSAATNATAKPSADKSSSDESPIATKTVQNETLECLEKIRADAREHGGRYYAIMELNMQPYSVMEGDVVVTKRLPGKNTFIVSSHNKNVKLFFLHQLNTE